VSEAAANEAAALLGEVIKRMGIEAKVTSAGGEEGAVRLAVDSPDSALLIGRKGRNLEALQYLINRMSLPRDANDTSERLTVDIEGYQERRRQSLEEMAQHLARRAKETGREMRVKPLSPQERRIIHLALQDDPDVRTFSLGNSVLRSVVISPKGAENGPGNDRNRRSRGGGGSRRPAGSRGGRSRRPSERRSTP
jgi:spoIIIJ-associated protein